MPDPIAEHYARERAASIARGEVAIEEMTSAELQAHILSLEDTPEAKEWVQNGTPHDDFGVTPEQQAAAAAAVQQGFADERLKKVIAQARADQATAKKQQADRGWDVSDFEELNPIGGYLPRAKTVAEDNARAADIKRLLDAKPVSVFATDPSDDE